jgi:hypothetical protein
MARLEIRKFIPAAPESVWAVLADLERQGDWMEDVRHLEVVSEQKQGVGAVLRVTSAIFGLPVVKDEMEITGWEPGRRIDVLHRTPKGSVGSLALHGTGSFVLDRVDGGTNLIWIEDFVAPLGPLGELGFSVAVRPHLRRVFARSLENVRRIACEHELIGAA